MFLKYLNEVNLLIHENIWSKFKLNETVMEEKLQKFYVPTLV